MESKWEVVFRSGNPFRAEMVKSILEKNNIPAVIVNKQASIYNNFGQLEVHVRHENSILAAIILEHEIEFE